MTEPTDNPNDMEQLARMYADDFEIDFEDEREPDPPEGGLSLEELSEAYANVTQSSKPNTLPPPHFGHSKDETQVPQNELGPVTPLGILEAVLFVGRPDNAPITATEIAGLMRGVTESEVDLWVTELNADYIANDRAFHIASVGGGYRMELTEGLESIHQAFLSPSRPARLSQLSIDCLSLVSYQPGITRDKLEEQLGKPASSILNQLVRRQLLEIRREKDRTEGGHKPISKYYTTDRFLQLTGLDSLDDLPTAEEWIDRV